MDPYLLASLLFILAVVAFLAWAATSGKNKDHQKH